MKERLLLFVDLTKADEATEKQIEECIKAFRVHFKNNDRSVKDVTGIDYGKQYVKVIMVELAYFKNPNVFGVKFTNTSGKLYLTIHYPV